MQKICKPIYLWIILFFLWNPLSHAETVKIIAEDDWYPYSGNTADGISGIAVDIVREVFRSEGIQVEFDVMNYDRGMGLVKDGKAVACFDAPRTKEVEQIYLWHEEPIFLAKSLFYARADYPGIVTGVQDLAGKILGLTQGYGYGDAIDSNKDLEKEYSKTDEIIVKKLIAKRVDLIILYEKVADYLASKLNLQTNIKPVGTSAMTEIYVAFSKTHPDAKKYCDLFNQGFRKIKADGTYQIIMDQWAMRLKNKTPGKTLQ